MNDPEEWWNIMGNYNINIFPIQMILHIAMVILIILFFLKPGKKMNIIFKGYISFSFAWIGIVLFLIYGNGLELNAFSALLFLSIAFFFSFDIVRNRIKFIVPELRYQKYIILVLLLLVSFYPLIGFLSGHIYPRMLFLSSFPCPTTALTLIFLSFSIPNIDLKPYILLLIWAIPFPIFIQIPIFGVYEDIIMLTTAIFALILLIQNRKLLTIKNLI